MWIEVKNKINLESHLHDKKVNVDNILLLFSGYHMVTE